MSAVLQQLKQAEESQLAEGLQKFKILVVQLANGTDEPELAEVTATLKASHKTTRDLENAIGSHKRRCELRDIIHDADAASEELVEIANLIQQEGEKLGQARQAHDAAVMPLYQRQEAAQQRLAKKMNAENELRKSCSCELQSDSDNLWREIRRIDKLKEEQENMIRNADSNISTTNDQNTAEAARKRIVKYKETKAGLQQQVDSLLKQVENVEQQMIEV